MAGAHGGLDALFVQGHTPLHRLAAECKVAATILFVFAVVATRREAVWAFGIHFAVVVAAIAVARLRPVIVLRRLAIEVPFVAFALLLPFFGGEDGEWAAWNILAKATLGVLAAVVLSATTPVADLLRGMERLRVPRAFTSIAGFMVRYADVISGELQRMRVARLSRCYDPRWIWQAKAIAATAGTLFVRSYERGERVYLAMLSRNYTGTLPSVRGRAASAGEWAGSLVVPTLAGLVALAAWVLR